MATNPIRLRYHFVKLHPSDEVTGSIPFNLAYEDIDVIPCLQDALHVTAPLVILDVLWDWRTRTLEVWVKEEKVRSLDRMAI